jgi:hypothetical protein
MWYLESLRIPEQKQLMSASAQDLRVALHYPDPMIGYYQLHVISKRATPAKFSSYKLALLLHKTIHEEIPECDWLFLNFEQIFTCGQIALSNKKNKITSLWG